MSFFVKWMIDGWASTLAMIGVCALNQSGKLLNLRKRVASWLERSEAKNSPTAAVRFLLCLLLICWTAAVIPASAQHFEQITGSLTQIADGRNEVWGLNGAEVYRFKANTKTFAKISVPNKGAGLTQIAVGGGTLLQKDEVWGVDVNGVGGGPVYHFNFSTNKFELFGEGAFGLSQIVVGPGYEDSCHPYEVWGIVVSSVFQQGTWRYNYCTSGFENIPNPSGINFSQIATGGGDVWALSPYSASDLNAWEYLPIGWTLGGYCMQNLPFNLSQITVGVNDVWTLAPNNGGGLFAFAPTALDQGWFGQASGITQVATGGDGVWGVFNTSSATGLITSYDFQQARFFYSVFQLTSPAVQIAVGSGAGVWAVDSGGRVYTFVRP